MRKSVFPMLPAVLLGGVLLAGTPSVASDAPGDVFKKHCASCHIVTNSGRSTVGPNLFGVVGRKAGSFPNFKYSKALKGVDFTWTEETLDKWLKNPRRMVKGSKMFFRLRDEEVRALAIEYLAGLK